MKHTDMRSDQEKFEAFKTTMIQDNEDRYGAEARSKYGDAAMEDANARFQDMTPAAYARFQSLERDICARLSEAVQAGTAPTSEIGQHIVALHKEWLSYTWKTYTAQAHRGLAVMYLSDPRFTAYYDHAQTGCAQFLHDAILHWMH